MIASKHQHLIIGISGMSGTKKQELYTRCDQLKTMMTRIGQYI